ncbi:hypothetical protein MRBLBA21_005037 [Peribacillus frigoritolerans]|uniref:mediterrocin family bacteriocin n=1 Tax=Peribacillus frigoritolerans TaxID=450367 RepID=UPI000BED3C20|nr:hypothetical protein [Peribacillus frigoritolerans]MCR8871996.1 hypothetical protein [Peribacillus frigoritolerans]PEF36913.1 hypothetical protein CON84_18685 [Bacillus sp. AFS094228]
MKKAILLVTCVLLSFAIFGSSASAAGQTYTVSNNFNSSWTKKITVGTGYFKYGFNTTAINEDFVHSFHPSQKINASLKNANGTFYASWNAVLGIYAKEVTHSGSTVSYTYSY